MIIKRTLLNGFQIYSTRSRIDLIEYALGRKGILIAMNAEKLLKSDPNIKSIVNDNIGYCDGIGVVWALRRKGINAAKIPGAELWYDLVAATHYTKKFYFIGGSELVIQGTVKKLKTEFENIHVVGFCNGFFEDPKSVLNDIVDKQPDIVFVAMGSPKQELLMETWANDYEALYMGLGGSFDIYCGEKKRAPQIFINLGLEWFHRLLSEPSRYKRQYVLLKFWFMLVLGRF